MAELVSVNVMAALASVGSRRGAPSGIDKRPVEGPVVVAELGLIGDRQVNRKHHGGPHKAVYAYAAEDARWWAEQLGREVPPGCFGENLTTVGVEVSAARVGEVWAVGTARMQVTMPREPCATFARWTGEPLWVKRFAQEGRTGAYLRVLVAGVVEAGAVIEVVPGPDDAPSVLEVFRGSGFTG